MGGVASAVKSIGGGIAKQFTGDGVVGKFTTSLAPKVGLGTYKADQYQVDPNAYDTSSLKSQMATTNARGAPQLGQAQINGSQASLAAPMTAAQTTWGGGNQTSAAQLGAANQMTAAQLSPDQIAQSRAQQEALAQQLTDQGNGIGPSLAQSQLQQGRDLNIANAMALAASQRGLTAGQGLRNISDQTVNANQLAAQQAATLRLQEQLAARQQLSGVLQGVAGQDINVANANAGYRQQGNLANQDALNQFALTQGGFNQQANLANQDAYNQIALSNTGATNAASLSNMNAANNMNQFNAGQYLSGANMNLQAQLAQRQANDAMQQYFNSGIMNAQNNMQSLNAGISTNANTVNQAGFDSGQKRVGSFIGGIAQGGQAAGNAGAAPTGMAGGATQAGAAGGGSGAAAAAPAAAAASDRRLKTNIKKGDSEILDLLENLGSHTYEYKDTKFGKGSYASPMAQELEKSRIGKGMVIDTPEGKMVDYARGAGTYLAAAAMLNKRIDKIESNLGAKPKRERKYA